MNVSGIRADCSADPTLLTSTSKNLQRNNEGNEFISECMTNVVTHNDHMTNTVFYINLLVSRSSLGINKHTPNCIL